MQKYFIAPEQFGEQHIQITGNDAHHIMNVMRAKPGAIVLVSDGASREAKAAIERCENGTVEARIVELLDADREPAVLVSIAQSLPKGDKMELIIQKCTEIGAGRFIPFVSERTIVQYDQKKEAKRLERWGKIAKEAAEQSHRNRVPAIDSAVSWKALAEHFSGHDLVLLCYEDEAGTLLRDVLEPFYKTFHSETAQPQQAARILVIIGPEGGFSAREVEAAVAAGARCVSLGRRILRAETAGMAACACIMYQFGELGGV
ncbi:16S rRNA (uracil(1498)-N(3))-methyltransferase [Paenibacillus apiarius]|uniref:16S rRNA (uracil(1498)-N(3))-methyltransferase n=1 Tax=Paenibacillus apiarius TaxID=46240 RepID=UPI001981B0CA|nr:16S rRNA (uracil(1498)-N(3))-methyltransferase [Paenibacillus apiarius]MBN3525891.1 16S rRNA (uracil(1498)-N(3))-methyltransferase [Paenibacillus apiarius]